MGKNWGCLFIIGGSLLLIFTLQFVSKILERIKETESSYLITEALATMLIIFLFWRIKEITKSEKKAAERQAKTKVIEYNKNDLMIHKVILLIAIFTYLFLLLTGTISQPN